MRYRVLHLLPPDVFRSARADVNSPVYTCVECQRKVKISDSTSMYDAWEFADTEKSIFDPVYQMSRPACIQFIKCQDPLAKILEIQES